jgi:hypothetical protein
MRKKTKLLRKISALASLFYICNSCFKYGTSVLGIGSYLSHQLIINDG